MQLFRGLPGFFLASERQRRACESVAGMGMRRETSGMRLHLSQVSKAGRNAMFPRDKVGIRTLEAHGKGAELPLAADVQGGWSHLGGRRRG